MDQNLAFHVRNQFLAAWKFCLSFLKREWELRDYPVSIRELENVPGYRGTRFKQYRYLAYILKWGAMRGMGNTQAEALRELDTALETARRNRPRMPRPGTRVPVQVQYASQERVSAHAELADDFTSRILELEWAWLTDKSSLWDFDSDETDDAMHAKIKEVYGVDVSDIKSGNLAEILERIAAARKPKDND